MPVFSCPNCRYAVRVKAEQFGQSLRCPACRGRFRMDHDLPISISVETFGAAEDEPIAPASPAQVSPGIATVKETVAADPVLACPRCKLETTVDTSRIDRPVFCASCGGCVWLPTGLSQTNVPQLAPLSREVPPVQAPPPVQTYPTPTPPERPALIARPFPQPRTYHFAEETPKGASPVAWAMLIMGAIFCAASVFALIVILGRGPGQASPPKRVPARGVEAGRR